MFDSVNAVKVSKDSLLTGFAIQHPYTGWTRNETILVPGRYTAVIRQGDFYTYFRNNAPQDVMVNFSSRDFPGLKVRFFGITPNTVLYFIKNEFEHKYSFDSFRSNQFNSSKGDVNVSGWFSYQAVVESPNKIIKYLVEKNNIKPNLYSILLSKIELSSLIFSIGLNHTCKEGIYRGADNDRLSKVVKWYDEFTSYLEKEMVNILGIRIKDIDTNFTKWEEL